jgi:hypothetical protein
VWSGPDRRTIASAATTPAQLDRRPPLIEAVAETAGDRFTEHFGTFRRANSS